MDKRFGFEKLVVWQKARVFVGEIYGAVVDFPDYEKFGLSNQLRRAGVSIASNIAEGANRSSANDKARFYELAFGSLMEVVNQLIIAHDLGFLSDGLYEDLMAQAHEIAAMLSALKNSIKQ